MPRRSRNCFRSRIAILWFVIGFITVIGVLSMILRGEFSDEPVNWTFRGIPLRDAPYGCEEIASLQLVRRVGRGTTKDVYVSVYRNMRIAVKMVSPKVPDIKACLRRKMFRDREECYVYANYKMMKEIALFQQLEHPNIAKLIGYCIQSDPLYSRERDHGVISVVEFGSKASLHRISDMSWQHKLQASIALADLLDYLENSPLGSLAIWDYKHSQFILTSDNKIKYSDLDDLSADEPQCETQEDCIIPKSNRIKVLCTHSRCDGFNAKFNLLRTTKEFLKPLLKETPEEYQTELDEIFAKLNKLEMNAKDVKTMLTEMNDRHINYEGL
ncbi:extracellular tyrosine-protein kinase PKDCC-like [Amphiura filiformis]|uniref:extracellular tyrosine-protein kinase PKDCC-like n=1 Tax=Amphiura filiformis TaxID=82378 RepID=UPI003B2144A4